MQHDLIAPLAKSFVADIEVVFWIRKIAPSRSLQQSATHASESSTSPLNACAAAPETRLRQGQQRDFAVPASRAGNAAADKPNRQLQAQQIPLPRRSSPAYTAQNLSFLVFLLQIRISS